jgi:hypothetical protein
LLPLTLAQTNGDFVPRLRGTCQRVENCERLPRHRHATLLGCTTCRLYRPRLSWRVAFDMIQVIVADAKHAFVEHVEEEVKEKKKDRETYEVSVRADLLR